MGTLHAPRPGVRVAALLTRNLGEALGGGVLFAVLYAFDLAGDVPAWLLAADWSLVMLASLTPTQAWLAGGPRRRAVDLRSGVAAVGAAFALYAMGWGPLFVSGLLVVVVTQIRENGSTVWRTCLAWCVVSMSTGQVLIDLGVLRSYVSLGIGNAAFLVGMTGLVLLGRALGTTTQRAEAEMAARTQAEAQFRSLVENSHDLVFLMNTAGEATWVSPASRRVLGREPEELLGLGWTNLVHPDDLADSLSWLADWKDQTRPALTVVRARHPDGTWHWWEVTRTNRLDDPAVQAFVNNVRDVTESHAYQERLSYQATRDSLTGLLNRSAFLERLESALARGRRKPNPVAVLFLDLDDFKAVNDRWGHHAGDLLLQTVGSRLEQAVRPGDTVGRLAGDEFVVLLEDLNAPEDADIVADRIRLALREPLLLHGQPVSPTASIGVAVTTLWSAETADEILHAADLRMYQAKQDRQDCGAVAGVPDPLDVRAIERGLTEREFFLDYQPVVDLATGRATWVEALVRWNHPTLGRLAPDTFIPQVEAHGLMSALGRRVLEDGCRTVRSWGSDPRLCAITLAVNASVTQLRDPAFPHVVRDVLSHTGLPPGQLVIEVTESLPLTAHDEALISLAALSAQGVRIALDDFGAGSASIAQLDLVRADIVKLDRQLINRIDDNQEGFLQGLIGFLLSRGITLVAEGIETAAQLVAVTTSGAQYGQGFHLARPTTPERVIDHLAQLPTEPSTAASQPL
jgi:diguanylate cyclase (GGDEF)-like protein/PAS domain S-box-containing protein